MAGLWLCDLLGESHQIRLHPRLAVHHWRTTTAMAISAVPSPAPKATIAEWGGCTCPATSRGTFFGPNQTQPDRVVPENHAAQRGDARNRGGSANPGTRDSDGRDAAKPTRSRH
jgi:hypothetical protein